MKSHLILSPMVVEDMVDRDGHGDSYKGPGHRFSSAE